MVKSSTQTLKGFHAGFSFSLTLTVSVMTVVVVVRVVVVSFSPDASAAWSGAAANASTDAVNAAKYSFFMVFQASLVQVS